MSGGLFPGRTTAKVICKLLSHYLYLHSTGVTRGHTSSQQVEKGEIVAIVCCVAALANGKRAWELPPWDLQNAKTKERPDKLTSRQFRPTNCNEGNTQGLEVKVKVAERRPIDPSCTSTYRQTNMTELGCPCMSATHSRLSCPVRRSLLCCLSFEVGRPKCPFYALVFRRVSQNCEE
jgi:hypothetical protein